MALSTVRVFEIVNLARRESVLAVTTLSAAELAARLAPRPAPMSHWPPEEEVFTDLLTDTLEFADAEAFVTLFARSTSNNGWKVLRWTP